MYIHLGQNTLVRTDSLVGIFDLDTSSVSKNTRQYLALMQKQGRVRDISGELPRSFVVCCEKGDNVVYLSQLSTTTLKKRLDIFDNIQRG